MASRDVVFLFGAGASFGAGGTLPQQPPLGVDLFPALANANPMTWGRLPPEITAEFLQRGFEAGMGAMEAAHTTAIPQLMREMAVYFVQFRPYKKTTAYCELIRHLLAKHLLPRCTLSSLNYDCVLEFSLSSHGVSPDYFGDASGGECPVLKPHGSCNFFAHELHVSQGVSYGRGVVFEAGIRAMGDPNDVIRHCLTETGLAPIMSLYMAGKPVSVSPSSLRSIQTRWRKAVAEASVVVCIGVNPWPDDKHIWDPLAATPARLLFVGNEARFNDWAQTSRTATSTFVGPRFQESVTTILQRL